MYSILKNSCSIIEINITNSLREAQYILPKNISPTITEMYTCFDEICSSFMVFNSIDSLLADNEISKVKLHNISRIEENCNRINSKVNYIQSIMPTLLNITNLDE